VTTELRTGPTAIQTEFAIAQLDKLKYDHKPWQTETENSGLELINTITVIGTNGAAPTVQPGVGAVRRAGSGVTNGGDGASAVFTREGIVGNAGEVVQPHLRTINQLDVDTLVGFRGSLARGFSGPHKGNAPFDPKNFDVDAFIVSDKLALEFGRNVRFRSGSDIEKIAEIQKSIDSTLRADPSMGGLRQDPFTFRIYTQKEIQKLQSRGDAQYFFINKID
jgi:hypothetical protein